MVMEAAKKLEGEIEMHLTNIASGDPKYHTTYSVQIDPITNSNYIGMCQVDFKKGNIMMYSVDKKIETYRDSPELYMLFQIGRRILIHLRIL